MFNKSFKSGVKKAMEVVGLLAITAVIAVGCSTKSASNSGNNVLSKVKSNGKLVIGTAPGYPPFEFVKSEGGKSVVIGADIDLADKISKKLGVELEIKAMDFDALIPALQAGKVDVAITGMTPTEKRKEAVDFSDIYYRGEVGVIVPSSFSHELKTEDDLKKLKIGVQKGSTQEAYVLEDLKAENTKSLTAVPDLIADMKNGNIDAIVVNNTVGELNVSQYDGIKLLKNVDLKSYKGGDTAAIAIKKGDNKEFIDELNSVIKELKDSGEYEKIMQKNIELATKQ